MVKDLERDKLVAWQHKYYLADQPRHEFRAAAADWRGSTGDVVGYFLLVGVLRLVISHHVTFFINSLAHMWGLQPYTDQNTARDNGVVALLTYGEGYHNFHHMFAHDYRNGVRWWQYDPSKWFIRAMAWLGLAYNLKTVPWFKIQRALLDTQFVRAQKKLALFPPRRAQLEQVRTRVAEEYEAFLAAVAEWTHVREQWLEQTKAGDGRALGEVQIPVPDPGTGRTAPSAVSSDEAAAGRARISRRAIHQASGTRRHLSCPCGQQGAP
jgi:stearoyl-CoA desaturase (delta-9 desaturase)